MPIQPFGFRGNRSADEVMVTPSNKNLDPNTQLVARIQAGDSEAESELVAQYSRPVSFELRQQARNMADVDDIFQDTFRIAIEKIRKGLLRQPKTLPRFLISIARFATIDFYRREGKHHPGNSISADLQQAHDNPLSTLLNRETSQQIHRLIPQLKSVRDREILLRFYIAEEEKDSICEKLDISRDHFNRVIHRAKKRFEVLLLKNKSFRSKLS